MWTLSKETDSVAGSGDTVPSRRRGSHYSGAGPTVRRARMAIPHPGVSELGFLADLKEPAEQIGSNVLGRHVRWEVEALPKGSKKRPDVVIHYDESGEKIASGEAKRPDQPEGVHPLVSGEIRDALNKAKILGVAVCFTTNFFESAVFEASSSEHVADLDRMQGGLIPLVSPELASANDWWATLTSAERLDSVAEGLRSLFLRIKQSLVAPIERDVDEVALAVFSRTTERLVADIYAEIRQVRDGSGIPQALRDHALRVQLNPTVDLELQYIVAQGVGEAITAALFYRSLADHFSLPPLLDGTNPRASGAMVTRIRSSLRSAIAKSGDYETIFDLSPAAEWALANGGGPTLAHWKELFSFIDGINFSRVTTDVIGSIFERLISPERRHEMGQHYTDSRIARSMSAWGVTSKNVRVADIACGGGTFLVEAYRVLSEYGLSHEKVLSQVFGNDLDPFAVHLASVNLATRDIFRGHNYPAVRLGDAFDLRPGQTLVRVSPSATTPFEIDWPPEGVDVILGNPPYKGSPNVALSKKSLSDLGHPAPIGMTKGNLAAWFALLSSGLLSSSGVWGLVMPTSVLQNTNLRSWRSWLRGNHDVVVWHTEDDVWFSDARVAVCVILASPANDPKAPRIHFVDIRERVVGELHKIDGIPAPVVDASVRDLSGLPSENDLLIAGTYPAALKTFLDCDSVVRLRDLTGAVAFSGKQTWPPLLPAQR